MKLKIIFYPISLSSRKQFLNKKKRYDDIQYKFLSTYNVPCIELGAGAGDTKMNKIMFSGLKDLFEKVKLDNFVENVGRSGWMNGD